MTIFFCSCHTKRLVYSASVPNNPYFKNKGDSKIAGYYSSGGKDGLGDGQKNNGYDIQAAYAITNHLAITGSLFKRHEIDLYHVGSYPYDSLAIKYTRSLADVGLGYFVSLNNSKTIVANIYGGIGGGKFSFLDYRYLSGNNTETKFHQANVLKGYIQPSINFFLGNVKIGLIGRASYLRYSNILTNYTEKEETDLGIIKTRKGICPFTESTFDMQLNIPKAEWVSLEFGVTTTLSRGNNNNYLQSRTFNSFLGAYFDLMKLAKRK